MSGPEGRSVGDLLLECDLTARRLLVDPDALDAGAMLRVWPELVQAGHELLNALPGDEPEAIPGVSVRPAARRPRGRATAPHGHRTQRQPAPPNVARRRPS